MYCTFKSSFFITTEMIYYAITLWTISKYQGNKRNICSIKRKENLEKDIFIYYVICYVKPIKLLRTPKRVFEVSQTSLKGADYNRIWEDVCQSKSSWEYSRYFPMNYNESEISKPLLRNGFIFFKEKFYFRYLSYKSCVWYNVMKKEKLEFYFVL